MRLVYLVRCAALACLAMALPAVADARPATAVPADAISVTAVAGRVKVHVHIPGTVDRVVWSKDPIYATALADLDNDGRLDLVASTSRHDFVVWRNTTAGFVRTQARRGPWRASHESGIRSADSGPGGAQISDEHKDPVELTPHAGLVAAVLATPHSGVCGERPSVALPTRYFGRAPPSLA